MMDGNMPRPVGRLESVIPHSRCRKPQHGWGRCQWEEADWLVIEPRLRHVRVGTGRRKVWRRGMVRGEVRAAISPRDRRQASTSIWTG